MTFWRSSEFKIACLLLLASGVLAIIAPAKVAPAFVEGWALAVKTIGLTVFAVIISLALDAFVPEDFAERFLSKTGMHHWAFYLLSATVLGILTPGPVYAIYPIVRTLKRKGVKHAILVSYITGQTIIGPARIPFEVGFFGWDFFLYRTVLALFMGIAAGALYKWLSRYWPDKEPRVPAPAPVPPDSTDL